MISMFFFWLCRNKVPHRITTIEKVSILLVFGSSRLPSNLALALPGLIQIQSKFFKIVLICELENIFSCFFSLSSSTEHFIHQPATIALKFYNHSIP